MRPASPTDQTFWFWPSDDGSADGNVFTVLETMFDEVRLCCGLKVTSGLLVGVALGFSH